MLSRATSRQLKEHSAESADDLFDLSETFLSVVDLSDQSLSVNGSPALCI